MTRVGNADQVLLLLREQLQRLDRARGQRSGRADASRKAAAQTPLARLRALRALGPMSEEDYRRTLVRALLTEELGEAVANDPSFQAVADDVFRILNESEEGRALVARAAEQLAGDA